MADEAPEEETVPDGGCGDGGYGNGGGGYGGLGGHGGRVMKLAERVGSLRADLESEDESEAEALAVVPPFPSFAEAASSEGPGVQKGQSTGVRPGELTQEDIGRALVAAVAKVSVGLVPDPALLQLARGMLGQLGSR